MRLQGVRRVVTVIGVLGWCVSSFFVGEEVGSGCVGSPGGEVGIIVVLLGQLFDAGGAVGVVGVVLDDGWHAGAGAVCVWFATGDGGYV